jgi:hypothetical protein
VMFYSGLPEPCLTAIGSVLPCLPANGVFY